MTFTPQYEGLIKGKKMTVILASGGVYTPGSPTEGYNTATAYLRQILGFIGITDVTVVLAGGTAGIAYGKTTLPELAAQYEPAVTGAAKA